MITVKYLRRLSDKLIRCIYPKKCPICGKLIPLHDDYCTCSNKPSRKIGSNFCKHCGYDIENCCCNFRNSVHLPEVTGVYLYSGRIRCDILNLKFQHEKRLAVNLGTEMAERCADVYCDTDFDIVTFVPMSERSLTVRGYNQSKLLAEQVGKMMFVPVEETLVKIKSTASQHDLKGAERRSNLINSVKLKDSADVKGKTILLCDDVKTTGSTLKECVNVLEKSGAEKVSCICVALSDFRLRW